MASSHRPHLALFVALAIPACAPTPREGPADEPLGEAASALKIAGVFPTGVDDKGALLPNATVDAHYTLTSTDAALPGPKTYAVAAAAGWVANPATSKWLSAQVNTKGANGAKYTYSTTFSLYGMDPATATLTGKVACDDTCLVLLNGVQVAKDDGANAWASLLSFTVPVGGPFAMGINTLAVQVTNTSGNTGAHLAELAGTASGCSSDAHCQLGNYCDNVAATCAGKLENGKPIPSVAGHVPVLAGKCTPDSAAATCQSGVCDVKDDLCGYANDGGPCTNANGPLVCRSKTCSVDGTCMPAAGCNADGDCAAGFCDIGAHTCTAKVANGGAMPKDAGHVKPTLDGTCNAAAAALVCQSGVCDPKDDHCGLALGDGPCTQQNALLVCRSGACSVGGTCLAKGTCNVDGDCAAGSWCSISTNTCKPTIANGSPLPSDPAHAKPALDGTCTPEAAALVCASGACDPKDALCGLAAGDGPCTQANGSVVCRTGACSVKGVCLPLGGCNFDSDCGANDYCDTSVSLCAPKLANGAPIPNDPSHAIPKLDGTCSFEVGKAVCASGACDPVDDKCGLADGDGPCTQAEAAICRSGQCSHNGTCTVKGGCNIDVDCLGGQWCAPSTHECRDALANGQPMPSDPAHGKPTLDGTCSAEAAALVCASAVCDPKDDQCGLADGHGPCSPADAATVCRSSQCTNELCGAGCTKDADCKAPLAVCDPASHACVECTAESAVACEGSKPVCDAAMSSCAACDGDHGSGAKLACPKAEAPLCDGGRCGACAKDADCEGHAGGPACDAASGACVAGCTVDAACKGTEWCDGTAGRPGACTAKVANGKPLPGAPAGVAKCTDEVGARVCASGRCDAKDDVCGLAAGDGPCASDDQCRGTVCDAAAKVCGAPAGTCSSDADCSGGSCKEGACVAKAAAAPAPTSDESGGCAVRARGDGDRPGLGAFAIALAAIALARRRGR